jgi:hypothetical protein
MVVGHGQKRRGSHSAVPEGLRLFVAGIQVQRGGSILFHLVLLSGFASQLLVVWTARNTHCDIALVNHQLHNKVRYLARSNTLVFIHS